MLLKQLISMLEMIDSELVFPEGFCNPHSYRMYYEDLAFEPTKNVKVGGMLTSSKTAIGKTFSGFKGGEYRMTENSVVWFAPYGEPTPFKDDIFNEEVRQSEVFLKWKAEAFYPTK